MPERPAAPATVTEIIDGPVASVDRVYAFDRLRDISRAAPRTVRRARTRLTAPLESAPGWHAAAEGTLLLEGDLIVCAGVTATTMREAIDLLMVRLRYRLRRLAETRRDQPIGSLPASAA
jgi:ribosome-associated translation inhibitor RaiA